MSRTTQLSIGARQLSIVLLVCFFSLSSQAQWTTSSNNIYNSNTGYVGVGTTTPRTNLEVNGYVHATTGISVGATVFSGNVPVNGLTLAWQGSYGAFNVGSGAGFGWRFRTNATDRLLITDALVTIPTLHTLIGTSTDNGNQLQVNGNLWTTGLVLPTGAAAGKILTSDANGNGTWQAVPSSTGSWSLTGNSGVDPSTTFLGTTDNTPLAFRTNNTERLRIDGTTGFVGINTTTPAFPLDVNGGLAVMRQGLWAQQTTAGSASGHFTGATSGNGDIILQGSVGNWPAFWIQGTQALLQIGGNGGTEPGAGALNITLGGNVLIGKTTQANSGYMLDVNGNGRFNQVVVNTSGADYVFDPGYRLSSLHDLEAYVIREHHLPGIAPAAQMQQEGLNLGDNQARLLAKIEELTLYLIKQDEETQALKEKIKTLEERNRTLEQLEKRIEKLEGK